METKQLLTFITLAETLNYPRAAERLQYTPSSLHRHIELLEEELGAPLFDKAGKRLVLTEEGRRLLPEARVVYARCQSFIQTARGGKDAHIVSVGGCELNTSFALREYLLGFAAQCPEVSYSLTTSPNYDALDLLRSGVTDLCFYYSRQSRRPHGLSFIPMYREPICCCAPKGSPLLERRGLRWQDLAGQPVAHSHDSCYAYEDYLEQMSRLSLPVGKTMMLGGISLVAQQAQKTGALMLVPYHALPAVREDFGMIPLDLADRTPALWETIVYRSAEELSPYARQLIRSAVAYARAECEAHPDELKAPASYDPYLEEL